MFPGAHQEEAWLDIKPKYPDYLWPVVGWELGGSSKQIKGKGLDTKTRENVTRERRQCRWKEAAGKRQGSKLARQQALGTDREEHGESQKGREGDPWLHTYCCQERA